MKKYILLLMICGFTFYTYAGDSYGVRYTNYTQNITQSKNVWYINVIANIGDSISMFLLFNGAPYVSGTWYFNGDSVAYCLTNSFNIVVTQSGTYSNYGGTFFICLTGDLPGKPGPIYTTSGKNACPGDGKTYHFNNPPPCADSYVWTPPHGATIWSGQGTKSVYVLYNSNFTAADTLKVKAVNSYGSSLKRKLKITRNGCRNAFEQEEAYNPASLNIYPNPANDLLVIDYLLPESSQMEIMITDITGKEILTKTFSDAMDKKEIDVKDFSKGIYFLKIKAGNEVMEKKFVKM